MAIAQVQGRVIQGGHAVKKEVIRRRLKAGWHNFQHIYKPLVDTWILYDNALDQPRYVDSGVKD